MLYYIKCDDDLDHFSPWDVQLMGYQCNKYQA